MLSQAKFYATFLSFLLCCAAANLLGQPPGGLPPGPLPSINLSDLTCSTAQIAKWDGAAWGCAADEQGGGGGSGFQVFDSDIPPKQVGRLITADLQQATVSVEITDALGNQRTVTLFFQPGRVFARTQGNLYESDDCSGTAYVRFDGLIFFPGLAEVDSTTLQNGGTVEVYVTSSDIPQDVVVRTTSAKNGVCQDIFDQLEQVLPLELIEADFFSLFPPPYDVREP